MTLRHGVTIDEGRRRIVRLIHRQLPLAEFFVEADSSLGELICSELTCWVSCDPATMLPTANYTPGSDYRQLLALTTNEYLEDDVNKFTKLARSSPPVATLMAATDGQPTRSARFVNTLVPLGYGMGDEMRALLVDGATPWGAVVLHRRDDIFDTDEVALLAALAPLFAEGIRRSILAGHVGADDGAAPGMLVLTPGNAVESMTAPARRWLAEVVGVPSWPHALPLVIHGLADHARRVAAGSSADIARARIPLRSGGWLIAHGSVLEAAAPGRVGITLVPARQPQVAAIIVDTYALSPREREITQLVLTGLSTDEIARRLAITSYTVQDHLKSIFDKVGVRSRRELVSQVFLRHYAPRVTADDAIGPDGWFAAAEATAL